MPRRSASPGPKRRAAKSRSTRAGAKKRARPAKRRASKRRGGGRGRRRGRRGVWGKRLAALARGLRRAIPSARTRRRWWRGWRGLPHALRWPVAAVVLVAIWLVANTAFQVARKPTELFFPISGALHKTPAETWLAYGRLFRRHATPIATPELLAALAQVEASGNPVARTYWRWALSGDPFAIFRPASSGVGLYQITDGTFAEARRLCIHDHAVARAGAWNDWDACWGNALYTRVIPSHAIEMTAAYLDHHVRDALRRHPVPGASLERKQELAALIHLCGAGAGRAHARRGLRVEPGQRCGTHDLRRYLDKVATQKARFARIAAEDRFGR